MPLARPASSLRFEAAVLAGVPVLGPLVGELGANEVHRIRGIFNGTTNHILSTMAADARDYDDVLREAQARGYAEADPSSDVEGLDAAYKLMLLSRLAWGGWIDVDAGPPHHPRRRQADAPAGITGVKRSHLSVAARLGLALKLVSRAERARAEACAVRSRPWPSRPSSRLGSTAGVTNVVEFDAEPVGRVTMAGPGAGGPRHLERDPRGRVGAWPWPRLDLGQLPPAAAMSWRTTSPASAAGWWSSTASARPASRMRSGRWPSLPPTRAS